MRKSREESYILHNISASVTRIPAILRLQISKLTKVIYFFKVILKVNLHEVAGCDLLSNSRDGLIE